VYNEIGLGPAVLCVEFLSVFIVRFFFKFKNVLYVKTTTRPIATTAATTTTTTATKKDKKEHRRTDKNINKQ